MWPRAARTVLSSGRKIPVATRNPCASPLSIVSASLADWQRRWTSSSSSPSPSTGSREAKPIQYNWIEGMEYLERYAPGGYHPIHIGQVLHDRYEVVDKLGFGGYSTVWLAHDIKLRRYVALKVGVADSSAVSHETRALQSICSASSAERASVPAVLDDFEVHGPNGSHRAFAMTPARCSLREASETDLFHLPIARALAGGVTLAMAQVHSHGYVHGDLHPGNILLELPSSSDQLSITQFYEKHKEPLTLPVTRRDGKPVSPHAPEYAVFPADLSIPPEKLTLADCRILISDFGESFRPDANARLGADCHTPFQYRPPEAILDPEAPLSFSADVWMLAVAIWDIAGMYSLCSRFFPKPDGIIAQYIDILGPLPPAWRERWSETEKSYFDEAGQRRKLDAEIWLSLDVAFAEGLKLREECGVDVFDKPEQEAFLDLIRKMLVFDPQTRITVDEVLQSEWMVKWVMPEVERTFC